MRVPRRTQDTVNTAPLPGSRTPVGGPRLVVEQPDITPLARSVGAAIEEARERADRTLIIEADNKLAELELGVRKRAEQRKGKDALGVSDEADEDWRKGTAEIEKTLTNSRQLEAFRQRAQARTLSLRQSVDRHQTQEWERFQNETFKTAVDLRLNDALANYADPQAVARAAMETIGLVEERGAQLGWGEDVQKARTTEALSRIHTAVIARHIDMGDDRAAAAWYQKAKQAGDVTGDDQAKIDKALEQASTLGESQRRADTIMAMPEVDRTKAYAEAAKITDPKLRRATEQELDTQFARRDRAEKDRDDALTARASEYAARGERPPASLLSQLRPAVRTALETQRKAVLRGETIETDPVAWYSLRKMVAEDPQKFAKLNLIEYRGKLSNGDFEQLGNLQATVIKKGGEAVRGFLTDQQIVTRTVEPLFPKAETEKAQRAERATALMEIDAIIASEKAASGKDQLPAERVQQIADQWALRRAFVRGEKPMGIEADGLGAPRLATERIPGAERTKLVTYLRRNGYSVSTSKVERLAAAARLGLSQATFDSIAMEP